ncbi:MAG: hypothetical protein ABL983_10115, partial [Nitrospira sp.]
YEELVGHEETVEPSMGEKIMKVTSNLLWTPYTLMPLVAMLEQAAARQETDRVISLLHELVPTFQRTEGYNGQKAEQVLSGTETQLMSIGSRGSITNAGTLS